MWYISIQGQHDNKDYNFEVGPEFKNDRIDRLSLSEVEVHRANRFNHVWICRGLWSWAARWSKKVLPVQLDLGRKRSQKRYQRLQNCLKITCRKLEPLICNSWPSILAAMIVCLSLVMVIFLMSPAVRISTVGVPNPGKLERISLGQWSLEMRNQINATASTMSSSWIQSTSVAISPWFVSV